MGICMSDDARASSQNSVPWSTKEFEPVPVLYTSSDNCCGCGACVAACPVHAISFIEDAYGYCYPHIDESLCIRCGRCKQVCGFQHGLISESSGDTYAAATSELQINQSASGGIFGALARSMLAQGGAVVGCKYENCGESLCACHYVVDDASELSALLGSKYVQSNMSSVFLEVRKLIKDGRDVLFSGTPCQIAGLRGYLGEDLWCSDHLITIDLVCHGVPNQRMLQGYLAEVEQASSRNSQIVDARFRPKCDGWANSLQLELVFSDGSRKFIPSEESSYYDAFLNLKTFRDSCYVCPFAGRQRPADLTMGDFWGVERYCPELLENAGGPFSLFSGVSCVLVNSHRGSMWLQKLGSKIILREVPFETIAAQNEQLKAPAVRPKDRTDWLDAFARGGWFEVEHLWHKEKLKQAMYKRAGKLVPAPVKRIIKAALKRLT